MPKIIENLREKLLAEAKRQVMEQGYSALTIRSVANACGVGVGTVYNYFPSKDMLIASFMLEDWLKCLEIIEAGCILEKGAESALKCIYEELQYFAKKYASIFLDKNAEANSSLYLHRGHELLRAQIAKPLKKFCERQDRADAEFLAEFIAESMLAWTRTEHSFEEIASVLLQLF